MAQQTMARSAHFFAFFTQRWRRRVPLARLFWRDMVAVGTAINIACGLASLLLLALKADFILAMLIFFAPMPYNIFLTACVWRTADLVSDGKASFARTGAALWLIAATLI